jgi:uncharacterized protein (TIGR02594 family)
MAIQSSPPVAGANPIFIPRWMPVFFGELGVLEDTRPGKSNPRIEQYHAVTRGGPALDDVAWCGAALCWGFEACGILSPRTKRAADWGSWGVPVLGWPFGAVLLFDKSDRDAKGSGHVALCLGASGKRDVFVFGGNQDNRWSFATRQQSKVLARRWPRAVEMPMPLIELV